MVLRMTFSLDSLNPPQRDAVTYDGNKHCLILAGAGSGKTRVLTHRIAWLISQGVAPSSILAITFTNKAAKEMKERALALVDCGDHSGLTLSTFHAFGARFLKQYAVYGGLDSSFSIYDETSQKTLIKQIMTNIGLIGSNASESDAGKAKTAVNETMFNIMAWKEAGKSIFEAQSEAKSKEAQNMATVYAEYEKQLLANNAADFADLLLKPLAILQKYENVRARVQARYRHILVDEFQDTNAVQLQLIKELSGPETRLTVVGDDDQSIYTWRGADPGAILEFSQRFGACDVFKLEQNYRSTQPILTCAGNLIACNEKRTEKRLWTDKAGGEPVHVQAFSSDWDEATATVRQLIARHQKLRTPWEKIAILYRKNSQSVSLERECTHQAVPYQVIGATGFYEREEIVDLIAYLRILANPADTVALRRILNKPARGIGDKTCEKIIELVEQKAKFGLQPTECILSLLQDIAAERVKIPRAGKNTIVGAQALLALFERVENWENQSPRTTLLDIMDEIHYMDYLKKLTSKKGQEFSEAEDRIQSLLQELDAHQQKSPNDLRGFLEDMTLIRPEADDARHAVNLMTIHSAKGLEFDLVYIVGAADGILPLERGGTCDVEEERRLMYVAMTRAKTVLTISYPLQSHLYGQTMCQTPSRFIEEMERPEDRDVLDFKEMNSDEPASFSRFAPKLAWSHQPASPKPKKQNDFSDEVGEGIIRPMNSKKRQISDDFVSDQYFEEPSIDIHADHAAKRHAEPEPFVPPQNAVESVCAISKNGRPISVGSRVSHAIHGRGIVTQLEKNGRDFKATVKFNSSGIRTIIARFLDAF